MSDKHDMQGQFSREAALRANKWPQEVIDSLTSIHVPGAGAATPPGPIKSPLLSEVAHILNTLRQTLVERRRGLRRHSGQLQGLC